MIINDTIVNTELIDIIKELNQQLQLNNLPYFDKIVDSGRNIQVCCPYHNERRPSAGIHKDTGMFHCFACNETHTLPELISYMFGKNDILGKWGWEWLLKNFISVQIENRKPIELNLSREHTVEPIKYVSTDELDSYRYIHSYMYKRKLTDEIIELFDIGYDRDSQCITFPIRDITGGTLHIARRSVNTKWFNYPSGIDKPVYGLYELKIYQEQHDVSIQELYVCESMLDALYLWTQGKFAVALNGLGTQLQFKQLRNIYCRKLILATDNDEAGMKARKRIATNVTNKLITQVILPSHRKDINDCTPEEIANLKEELYY